MNKGVIGNLMVLRIIFSLGWGTFRVLQRIWNSGTSTLVGKSGDEGNSKQIVSPKLNIQLQDTIYITAI